LKGLEEVQNWIKSINEDPILKILLENSNLTKIQLETFLIEILSKYFCQDKIKPEKKASLRLKGKISRGSFNRTLKQAKMNIIRSIYTILLLGYLKIADSSTLLSRCFEVSGRLRDYVELHQEMLTEDEEKLKVIELVRKELERILLEYASSSDV